MIWRRTRIRLALGLSGVQLLFLVAFSVGVYSYVTSTFDYDGMSGDSLSSAEAGFAALRAGLLWALLATALVVPVLSYVVAGLILRPLRLSSQRQRDFVDDAAHDLRTPLTAVRGQLELALARRRTADEHRDLASRALVSVGRLEDTLSDLLVYADGDLRRITTVKVDVETIITDALDDVDRTDRVSFHPPARSVSVVAAPDLLRRAFVNLVDNALRYSTGRVIVSLEASSGMARVQVRDAGPGMSPASIRHAFVRRWRGADDAEGRGLGLALVRQAVELHRGDVRIHSVEGVGTEVSVTLPLAG